MRSVDEILREYGEDPRDPKTVWSVQGTRVISHRALERIAAKAGISFEVPKILRSERDEAVILVLGTMGDKSEWSIGEALVNDGTTVGNYKVSGRMAAYPYAMAEKRAKDRVALKLLNLAAYSEEEADDFKTAPRDPPEAAHIDKPYFGKAGASDMTEDQVMFLVAMQTALDMCQSRADVAEVAKTNHAERVRLKINDGGEAWKRLRLMINERSKAIEEEFQATLAAKPYENILAAG